MFVLDSLVVARYTLNSNTGLVGGEEFADNASVREGVGEEEEGPEADYQRAGAEEEKDVHPLFERTVDLSTGVSDETGYKVSKGSRP